MLVITCIYKPLCHEGNVTQGKFLSKVIIGFNSEFYFSMKGYLTKTKEHSLPNYFPLVRGENKQIYVFLKIISTN